MLNVHILFYPKGTFSGHMAPIRLTTGPIGAETHLNESTENHVWRQLLGTEVRELSLVRRVTVIMYR